ncbi:hypothetical protein Sjap_005746 [Stephania japonica]|uniref:Uncharacterized protein n=1 Tax=Stephania japonica TaxID=461633 RepID=A0AAP0K4M7_9MAGN
MENSSGQQEDSTLTTDTSFTYNSPYPIFATALSSSSSSKQSPHHPLIIAVGSFLEDYSNKVDIISFDDDDDHHHHTFKTHPTLSFDHPYPPTKLMFNPTPQSPDPLLLASSGDYVRIWEIHYQNNSNNNNNNSNGGTSSITQKLVLDNSKCSELCSPLTSFDWNPMEPRRIGTSSIDTTCTVWDVERGVVEMQLIAHDKEVHDIAWGEASVFASASADGSVRIFDLRDKEHSTIIYESADPTSSTPLLRLAWNRQDLRYIAATLMDSNRVVVLDIRFPVLPVMELSRHRGCVNAIAWAPQSSRHICSAADDSQALIWELPAVAGPTGVDPVLAYTAESEINQMQWSALQPDWIAIAFASKLQLLKV